MELQIGKPSSKIRLLIYGSPGTRKTSFSAQAPNPIFLDYENSTTVLRGTPLSEIPVVSDPKELKDFEKILSFVRSKNDYETYVIDSVSSMYETYLMEHMRTKKNVDRHIALFQDFRKITNVMKELFYELIHVDKNVVIIAHEKELRDPETNKLLQVRPFIPPEIEKSIERLINECFYFETKTSLSGESEHLVYVESQGRILAKNRQYHLTENKYKNTNWKEIYG